MADTPITGFDVLTNPQPEDTMHVINDSETGLKNKELGFGTFLRTYNKTLAETAAGLSNDDLDFKDDPGDARRYGVVGDNSTNDAAAIQSVIDQQNQGGAIVRLPTPSSKYFIGTTTLVVYDGTVIAGEVNDNTSIRYTGSANAFESATKGTTRIFRGIFRNFKIEGNLQVAGSVGVNCLRMDRWLFHNVWVLGFDLGVVFDGTGPGGQRNDIEFGNYEGCNTGIQVINGANEIHVYNAKIDLNDDFGVDVQGGNSVSVIDCNLESNGTHVRTAASHTRVVRGRMEAATTAPWETTSTAEYFHISEVFRSSDNGDYINDGMFSDIHWEDHISARGYNMVKNGSMETWSAGTTSAPDCWTLVSPTVARDTDQQAGDFSALLTATATSDGMFQDVDIPVLWRDERKEFLVSCRIKLGTSTQAALAAVPQDAGGTTRGVVINEDRTTAAGSRVETTTSDWQTLKVIVRPEATAVRIRVSCEPDRSAGTGTCFFDAVNISPLAAAREEYYENTGDLAPLIKNILVTTATIDFDATDAGTSTVTVPNAAVGDPVLITPPAETADVSFQGRVSSADTVTVAKIGAGDPASGSYVVTVFNLRL